MLTLGAFNETSLGNRDICNVFLFQVAAELDRSDTARVLIERSAEASVVDDSGMTALVLMISKMPSVVS